MRLSVAALSLLTAAPLLSTIVDRIAIVTGNSIVKDSDIERDIRVTSFLNSQPLVLNATTRRQTASRLVDQIFIRREIDLGDYPVTTWEQATKQVNQLIKDRFPTESSLQAKLQTYGISEPDLVSHFQWQSTVLKFIDSRFRPAALVTDQDIARYYTEHEAAFRKEHPGKSSLDNVREEINDILTAQQVDKIFFAWLDTQRKQAKIKYYEEDLR